MIPVIYTATQIGYFLSTITQLGTTARGIKKQWLAYGLLHRWSGHLDYGLTVMCGLTFLVLCLLRHVALFFKKWTKDILLLLFFSLRHLRTFSFLLLKSQFHVYRHFLRPEVQTWFSTFIILNKC